MEGNTIGSVARKAEGRVERERLHIAVTDVRELLLGQKTTLEKIHGREMTWDQFFATQAQYLDLPAEKSIVFDVQKQLSALQQHLEKNREGQAANIVEAFSDAMLDVLQGRLMVSTLTTAIVNAKDE